MAIANYTTEVSVEKTMGEVTAALARRGVSRIATVYDENGTPAGLEFTMVTEYGPRDFALPVRTEGVLTSLKREAPPRYQNREHAAKVAWRIARDWLRAQAALIDADLATLDEVMFPWMLGGGRAPQTAFSAYRTGQLELEK